jgi:two-component system LytT family response regulator
MMNKPIPTVIVDDEPKNIALLEKMIGLYCPQLSVCGHATSIESATKIIRQENPTVVFLDIEIRGGNAFQLLDLLKPVKFEVIFVTAYDNYLLKAIKYSALDYLLKPINIEELIIAVNKSVDKIQSQQTSERIESLLQNIISPKPLSTIAVPTSLGFDLISVHKITRCEAKGGYTIIFMNEGRSYTASKTLKEYEELLPEQNFFRVHHSHIVNTHFIAKYHKGKGGVIEMMDKSIVPLAARRKNDFLKLFLSSE